MGFWTVCAAASMPIVQVLLVGLLGAYLASGYSNIMTGTVSRDMNKVVFNVFTPALVFGSLAKAVTAEDIVSWWFMPVNIGIIFLAGGVLGWIACNILRPPRHLRGLIIAFCSAGNFGNLMLVLVPAACDENGVFGTTPSVCRSNALPYVSMSMALGGLYLWTHTHAVLQKAGKLQHKFESGKNANVEVEHKQLYEDDAEANLLSAAKQIDENDANPMVPLLSRSESESTRSLWGNTKAVVHQVVVELLTPPTLASITGFIVGAIPWLKTIIIGDNAPLKVVQDSIEILGDGTVPCITLILGANLIQGLRKSAVSPATIVVIVVIRYVLLPVIGIAVVKGAYALGFLPSDPLFRYVLLLQFALPPAMNIGTISQLYDIGQEECSVIFLWTYTIAAVTLTVWSTIFMSILS